MMATHKSCALSDSGLDLGKTGLSRPKLKAANHLRKECSNVK